MNSGSVYTKYLCQSLADLKSCLGNNRSCSGVAAIPTMVTPDDANAITVAGVYNCLQVEYVVNIKRSFRKHWLAICLACSFLLAVSSASAYAYIHNQNHKNQLKAEASHSNNQGGSADTNTNVSPPSSSTSQPAQPQGTTTTNAAGCTITNTPYSTTYIDDPTIPQGQTKTTTFGWNGSITKCPSKPPLIDPPINEVIHRGSYIAPAPIDPCSTYQNQTLLSALAQTKESIAAVQADIAAHGGVPTSVQSDWLAGQYAGEQDEITKLNAAGCHP